VSFSPIDISLLILIAITSKDFNVYRDDFLPFIYYWLR